MTKKEISSFGVFIWILAVLFYLYEFFLRVSVATISDFVMLDLRLNAGQFALMGAGFYLCYAAMQFPASILIDRYGPRLLLFIAICITALGAVCFSFSQGFISSFLSRVLAGFGSSFAYMGLLMVTLNWFPRKHFGLLVGIASLLGALGPTLAGGPFAFLLQFFNNDWREVIFLIGVSGFLLAFLVGIFVRSSPKRAKGEIIHLNPYPDPLSKQLFLLFKNGQAWWVILYAALIFVSLPLLGAYWGTAYLQARGFSLSMSASASSMLWIGLAVGSLLLVKISDLMKRRKPMLFLSALLGLVASVMILYPPFTDLLYYGFLFFCIGIASSVQALSFAVIAEHVHPERHAVALGLNNTVIIFFVALFPAFAGYLISRATTSYTLLTVSDMHKGLVMMPFLYAIAFLIAFFFISETFCRQRHEVIKVEPPSV